MDISLKWMNQFVKVDDVDVNHLAELITSAGIEIEDIKTLATGSDLVIGYVKECEIHPDSDHLQVCKVEVEPGIYSQIVCGAPNVASGQKVIVAKPGCVLSKDFTIKKSVIRGVESNGMICSLSELGIDARFLSEEQKAGIEVLEADAPIGVEALEYLGLKDTILELGLTPNRADCLAVSSFAYEIAAVLNREIQLPKITKKGISGSGIEVSIETDLCPTFGVKLVKGVKTKESPQWLKSILMASGVKPINNVVDISNFVMLETGQPIHMYDYDKLKDKKFVIKTGFDCEAVLLDGEIYKIEPSDLIISENEEIACVAGIYGAESTKIDENSVNIVIEAATFDGPTLRATARRLNLLTDASSRFIKNALNSAASAEILERCANLLEDLGDATEIYESVIVSTKDYTNRVLKLKTSHVNKLLGTKITDQIIADAFNKLNFSYTSKEIGCFEIVVPSYRNDITIEADLIEEVARMYGYDLIPSTLPLMRDHLGGYTEIQFKRNLLTQTLVDLGLNEVKTYTLVSPSMVDDFNVFHKSEMIPLLSPLGEERSNLRKSLIPSMLQVVNYNDAHTNKDIGIFEISNTYSNNKEISILSIVGSGIYQQNKWENITKKYDYYVMKGFVEVVFERLGIEETRYQLKRVEKENKYLHPGRSAYILFGKEIVGYVGEIHPNMQKKYDVNEGYVVELNLSSLLMVRTNKITYKPLPVYPSVLRDIAVVVDSGLEVAKLVISIKKAGKKIVRNVEVFDVYEGEHIESGKKSVALAISFLDEEKTLQDKDINGYIETICLALEKECGAQLRK